MSHHTFLRVHVRADSPVNLDIRSYIKSDLAENGWNYSEYSQKHNFKTPAGSDSKKKWREDRDEKNEVIAIFYETLCFFV